MGVVVCWNRYDQQLQGNIDKIAEGVSCLVKHTLDPMALVRDANECLRACMRAPRGVATLVLPADASWNESPPASVRVNAWPAPLRCSDEVSTRILGRRTAPFPHLLIPHRVPHDFNPRS